MEIYQNKVARKNALTRVSGVTSDFRHIIRFLEELSDAHGMDEFHQIINRYPSKGEFSELIDRYFEFGKQNSTLERQAKESRLDLTVMSG